MKRATISALLVLLPLGAADARDPNAAGTPGAGPIWINNYEQATTAPDGSVWFRSNNGKWGSLGGKMKNIAASEDIKGLDEVFGVRDEATWWSFDSKIYYRKQYYS